MVWIRIQKLINITIPVIGIGLILFYEICGTSCSYLQGTLVGINLKYIGILFMAILLAMSLPPLFRFENPVNQLRSILLSAAIGGEIVLVHFQIIHEVFCPFCLAFGLCVLVLFASNFTKMNKYMAVLSFLAGIGAFWLFFEGSVIPLYV